MSRGRVVSESRAQHGGGRVARGCAWVLSLMVLSVVRRSSPLSSHVGNTVLYTHWAVEQDLLR